MTGGVTYLFDIAMTVHKMHKNRYFLRLITKSRKSGECEKGISVEIQKDINLRCVLKWHGI